MSSRELNVFLPTQDGEDERVGEVLVQGQLHHVPAQLQQASGLGQADENVDTS